MFEKYFVTCPVAVALRAAGFDEQCMAAWEHYKPDGLTAFPEEERLIINYSNIPPEPGIYNQMIQEELKRRPGLFEPRYINAKLHPWLYAAPLYDQVTCWLLDKGLYLHPYKIPWKGNFDLTGWGVNIFTIDGSMVWPAIPDNEHYNEVYQKEYLHQDKRAALDQAILAAIKLLPNEPKMDV